jgi:hypothetical protein
LRAAATSAAATPESTTGADTFGVFELVDCVKVDLLDGLLCDDKRYRNRRSQDQSDKECSALHKRVLFEDIKNKEPGEQKEQRRFGATRKHSFRNTANVVRDKNVWNLALLGVKSIK